MNREENGVQRYGIDIMSRRVAAPRRMTTPNFTPGLCSKRFAEEMEPINNRGVSIEIVGFREKYGYGGAISDEDHERMLVLHDRKAMTKDKFGYERKLTLKEVGVLRSLLGIKRIYCKGRYILAKPSNPTPMHFEMAAGPDFSDCIQIAICGTPEDTANVKVPRMIGTRGVDRSGLVLKRRRQEEVARKASYAALMSTMIEALVRNVLPECENVEQKVHNLLDSLDIY